MPHVRRRTRIELDAPAARRRRRAIESGPRAQASAAGRRRSPRPWSRRRTRRSVLDVEVTRSTSGSPSSSGSSRRSSARTARQRLRVPRRRDRCAARRRADFRLRRVAVPPRPGASTTTQVRLIAVAGAIGGARQLRRRAVRPERRPGRRHLRRVQRRPRRVARRHPRRGAVRAGDRPRSPTARAGGSSCSRSVRRRVPRQRGHRGRAEHRRSSPAPSSSCAALRERGPRRRAGSRWSRRRPRRRAGVRGAMLGSRRAPATRSR